MTAARIHPKALTFSPLYQQVRESILQRVSSGEWQPGDYLPSEISLAEQYQVSQGTLRKALNALTREKVLVRFQGKGTAVAVLNESSAMFRFFTLVDEKGERVFPSSTVHDSCLGQANETEAAALGLASGDPVIRIERVRYLDESPVINEIITLNHARFPGFDLRREHIVNTLYEFYERNYKLTVVKANETICTCLADAGDALRLNLPVGSPLLLVTRVAYGLQGQSIEFRISRINTGRYHYFSHLG